MRFPQHPRHRDGHILILDDEPAIRRFLGRVLEQRGYNVLVARNVAEALDAIGPELIAAILDVLLVTSGGKSGLDVLAAIRASTEGADVPVLMCTGFGLSAEVVAAIHEHGVDLLPKPLSLSVLSEWLAKHVDMPAGG